MKYKKELYNQGDLIYWYDFWQSKFGVGLFLNYVNNFNVKDIYVKNPNIAKNDVRWLNVLINDNNMLTYRIFPPTSVCLQNKYKSIGDFKSHVENFRPKKRNLL